MAGIWPLCWHAMSTCSGIWTRPCPMTERPWRLGGGYNKEGPTWPCGALGCLLPPVFTLLSGGLITLLSLHATSTTAWQDPLHSSTLRYVAHTSRTFREQACKMFELGIRSSMWSTGELPSVKAIVLRYVNAAPSQVSRWHLGQNGKRRTVVHEGPLG